MTLSLARRCSTTEPSPQGNAKVTQCRSPDLNWGLLDFQSSALPTELPRRDAYYSILKATFCQIFFKACAGLGCGMCATAQDDSATTSCLLAPVGLEYVCSTSFSAFVGASRYGLLLQAVAGSHPFGLPANGRPAPTSVRRRRPTHGAERPKRPISIGLNSTLNHRR